jgi:hypothetical protein
VPLSYTPHDTVNANVTGYSDTGLAPLTTYWYRISAMNDDGDSGFSNEESATTEEEAGAATALLLGSITVSTVSEVKGQKRQHAEVVVMDNNGLPFDGALVEGYFSGTITENDLSASSDSSGLALFDTSTTAQGGMSFEFCVTGISDPADVLAPVTTETCASF